MNATTNSPFAFSYANLSRSSPPSTPPRVVGGEQETELTATIGRTALVPYQPKARFKQNNFSITKVEDPPQSARLILTQRIQQATSTMIDVPKSQYEQSELVTQHFKDSINQDRTLFESVRKNLEKATLDVFKSREEIRHSIQKFAQDVGKLVDGLITVQAKLIQDVVNGKNLNQVDYDSLNGLIETSEKIIKISMTTAEQHQKALDSACINDGAIFERLINAGFELRAKEFEIYARRLDVLSTRQDAELKSIVEVHGLKLAAEAQMFEQLIKLAELELKSDQQNFEQQKEIQELEHSIETSKKQIELAEQQLKNDKELGELYAYTQNQLQTHQIDANTRCELAKTAAKEAVKMERTRMERETRMHDTSARRAIEVRRIDAHLEGLKDSNRTSSSPCIVM